MKLWSYELLWSYIPPQHKDVNNIDRSGLSKNIGNPRAIAHNV
jgi:hypothetical protein